MNNKKPKVKRISLCNGVYCNADNRATRLYRKLEPMIHEINGDQYPHPIKLMTANCLDMCGVGPNLIIRPGNLTFNHLTEDDLEDIVNTHLKPNSE